MDNDGQGFPQEATKGAAGGTQAVARAAALLREIATCATPTVALVDLAARLELERPTAYRILRRLVLEGLVEQDPKTRGYALGPLVYELGLATRPPQQHFHLGSDAARQVAEQCGDTVFAIVQSGMDSVCIDRQEGAYPVKAFMMNPGRRRPMGIGSGSLALLGRMPEHKAAQILEANGPRLRAGGAGGIDELLQDVERSRSEGFVVRAANEAPEILSMAVAACNAYGTPVLALSISALRFRIEHRQELLLSILYEAKNAVEKSLAEPDTATPDKRASSAA